MDLQSQRRALDDGERGKKMEKRELERDKNPLSPLAYSIVIDLPRLMMVQVQLLSLFFLPTKSYIMPRASSLCIVCIVTLASYPGAADDVK